MKHLVCLSGGLDSSTLLMKLVSEGAFHGEAVFFHYGSKQNEREWKAAEAVANLVKVPISKMDISGVFKGFKSALMKDSTEVIPNKPYSKDEVCNAVVPARNLIFASIMAGLAQSKRLDRIHLGVHSGDHLLYPDCRPEFIEAAGDAVFLATAGVVELKAPFMHKTKEEIAEIALNLNSKEKSFIELTYSCYNGDVIHCGKCPTCRERRNALGLFDPTKYKD